MDSKQKKYLTCLYKLTLSSGMARTFTAAPALVKLMSGQTWESAGLPDVFQITASRLDALKTASASKVVTV